MTNEVRLLTKTPQGAGLFSVSCDTDELVRRARAELGGNVPRWIRVRERDGEEFIEYSDSTEGPWRTAEEIAASKAAPIEPPRKL